MARRVYISAAGERLPGVTTVLTSLGWNRDGLLAWANRAGLEGRTLDEARARPADIGTLVHEMVEAHLWGDGARFDRLCRESSAELFHSARRAFEAYERWAAQQRGTIVATEVSGVDEAEQVGFTADALRLEENGALTLLDWKSSRALYAEHLIQVSTYVVLIERVLGTRLAGAHLVRFGKEHGNFSHQLDLAAVFFFRAGERRVIACPGPVHSLRSLNVPRGAGPATEEADFFHLPALCLPIMPGACGAKVAVCSILYGGDVSLWATAG